MVDTTAQVEDVLFGPQGVASGTSPGDRVICMSTVDPMTIKRLWKRLAGHGVGLLDSPVAGMEKGAREGTLRAYVGGDADDLAYCRPVLETMASTMS